MIQNARNFALRTNNLRHFYSSLRFLSGKKDDAGCEGGEKKEKKVCGRPQPYSTKPKCKKKDDSKKEKGSGKDPCQDLKERFGPKDGKGADKCDKDKKK